MLILVRPICQASQYQSATRIAFATTRLSTDRIQRVAEPMPPGRGKGLWSNCWEIIYWCVCPSLNASYPAVVERAHGLLQFFAFTALSDANLTHGKCNLSAINAWFALKQTPKNALRTLRDLHPNWQMRRFKIGIGNKNESLAFSNTALFLLIASMASQFGLSICAQPSSVFMCPRGPMAAPKNTSDRYNGHSRSRPTDGRVFKKADSSCRRGLYSSSYSSPPIQNGRTLTSSQPLYSTPHYVSSTHLQPLSHGTAHSTSRLSRYMTPSPRQLIRTLLVQPPRRLVRVSNCHRPRAVSRCSGDRRRRHFRMPPTAASIGHNSRHCWPKWKASGGKPMTSDPKMARRRFRAARNSVRSIRRRCAFCQEFYIQTSTRMALCVLALFRSPTEDTRQKTTCGGRRFIQWNRLSPANLGATLLFHGNPVKYNDIVRQCVKWSNDFFERDSLLNW
uniref:Uncharacterized protein n=1 Tax=Globodera rostochiensis TaxID=31243 RepID=A0A914HET8_GLORO